MQSELYKGFSDEGFQKQLKELETKHSKSSRDFVTERTQLFLSVQSVVLPKYGFEGTQKGVVLMLNAFQPFMGNADFLKQAYLINQALGLEPNADEAAADTDVPKMSSVEESVEEVEVTVKHAVNNDTTRVIVPSTAKIQDVKLALAETLNLPDVASKARLVRKAGNAFTSLKDSEALGTRRTVLVMGVDDLSPSAEAPTSASGSSETPPTVAKAPELSRDEAFQLQTALRERFAAPEFREKLKNLSTQHAVTSPEFITGRAALIRDVQHEIIPNYGLEANAKGVRRMLQVLDFHSQADNYPEMAVQGALINHLLMLGDSPPFEDGEIAEVVIADGPHQGNWLKVQILSLGDGLTYNVHVLPTTEFDNACGGSDTDVLNVHCYAAQAASKQQGNEW